MKLIFILLTPFIFCSAHSQVMKFRAVKFVCTRYNNQDMDPPESKNLKGTPVELNMDSSILYIHSPTLQVFQFNDKPLEVSEKDSIMSYSFFSVDKNKVKLTLTHLIYESGSAPYFAAVILDYRDKTYIYYLQKE